VIVLAVRWYLRFGLSDRDVEALLAERGVDVDHVTVDRWALRFPRLLAERPGPVGTPLATAGKSTRPM
jgi:transposase-like protein